MSEEPPPDKSRLMTVAGGIWSGLITGIVSVIFLYCLLILVEGVAFYIRGAERMGSAMVSFMFCISVGGGGSCVLGLILHKRIRDMRDAGRAPRLEAAFAAGIVLLAVATMVLT